ncbi:FeoB-associated Cys-rich membrane protein [Roseburia sp. 831b]|uniref:FeoB-associated Cys-rich membrane protein n=1 Tax=Roseburia sp. 831b TaxID=1261635 RepID=UPI0009FB068F
MKWLDWFVLLFLLFWLILVIRYSWKKRKNGGCMDCGHCSGQCSSCGQHKK